MNQRRKNLFRSLLVTNLILLLVAPLPAQVGRHQGMIEPNIAEERPDEAAPSQCHPG